MSRPAPWVGYELQPVECAVCGVGAELGSRTGDQSVAGSAIPEKLCFFLSGHRLWGGGEEEIKTGS